MDFLLKLRYADSDAAIQQLKSYTGGEALQKRFRASVLAQKPTRDFQEGLREWLQWTTLCSPTHASLDTIQELALLLCEQPGSSALRLRLLGTLVSKSAAGFSPETKKLPQYISALLERLDALEPDRLPYVLTMTIALGSEDDFRHLGRYLCRWLVSRNSDLRSFVVPGLVTAATRCPRSLLHEAASPMLIEAENAMSDSLLNAGLVAEKKDAKVSMFKLSAQNSPATELDGSPASDFFTLLNFTNNYGENQMYNIYIFSMLQTWVRQLCSPPPPAPVAASAPQPSSTPSSPSLSSLSSLSSSLSSLSATQANRNSSFLDAIVAYCLRVIGQSELQFQIDPPAPVRHFSHAFVESVFVEAVRILDQVCSAQPHMSHRVFPAVRRAFQRLCAADLSRTTHRCGPALLAALEFFLKYSSTVVADVEPLFRQVFASHFVLHYTDSIFAVTLFSFCLRHCKQPGSILPGILLHHYSHFFRLLAWTPHAYASEFAEILPLFISSMTAEDVLHRILDLPLLAASLERLERSGPGSPEHRLLYNAIPLFSQPASANDFNNPVSSASSQPSSSGVDESHLLPPIFNTSIFRALVSTDLGHAADAWSRQSTPNEFGRLCSFFQEQQLFGARTSIASRLVPVLLDIFFGVLSVEASPSCLLRLLPVLLRRSLHLSPGDAARDSVRSILVERVVGIVRENPAFLADCKSAFCEYLHEANTPDTTAVFIQLVAILGDYASPMTDARFIPSTLKSFCEVLEVCTYERLSILKSQHKIAQKKIQSRRQSAAGAAVSGSAPSSAPSPSSGASPFFAPITRLPFPSSSSSSSSSSSLESTGFVQSAEDVKAWLVLLTSLTKLGIRCQDVIPRVLICVVNVIKQQHLFHASIMSRANECIRLLRTPSLSIAILGPPNRRHKVALSTGVFASRGSIHSICEALQQESL